MSQPSLEQIRQQLHEDACAQGLESYDDPVSGIPVMTAVAHLKRGQCCSSGCRHCPYGFKKQTSPDSEKQ